MHREMMVLAVVLASLVAFAPGMNAQSVRMTATVLPSQDPAAFDEIVKFCPGCRAGAVATLEFGLRAPLFPEEYDRNPSFDLAVSPNAGTVSLGGETWPLLGTLVISADRQQRRGSIVLESPSISQPVRGVVRASLSPWLSIDIPVIPLDSAGRMITVNTTAIRYDNGNSHMSVVLCRGAEGECEGHGFALFINSVTIDAGPRTVGSAPLVIFIGGAGDETVSRNVIGLFNDYKRDHPTHIVEYRDWLDDTEVARMIRDFRSQRPGARVAVIGHSWGGSTSYNAAAQVEEAHAIDLMITLDAVTNPETPPETRGAYPERPRPGRGSLDYPGPKPSSVTHWINVYANFDAEDRPPWCVWKDDALASLARWTEVNGADQNVPAGRCHVDIERMMEDSAVVTALAILDLPRSAQN
jgi:pimeloyl-ACP methyl ester carboxylesterase